MRSTTRGIPLVAVAIVEHAALAKQDVAAAAGGQGGGDLHGRITGFGLARKLGVDDEDRRGRGDLPGAPARSVTRTQKEVATVDDHRTGGEQRPLRRSDSAGKLASY